MNEQEILEHMKKFRLENPYYPIDPFQRVSQMRMEFITDDNMRHQKILRKKLIQEYEEAPY